ncbi:minor capsid protein [Salibacterium aidingense]|uniref:minor capsid protein n=1 Tax=Salibacterium aidingense TaxID=384933 RepID=UPI003BD9A40F
MMGFNTKIESGDFLKRIGKLGEEGQKALDSQILKDSNNYVPMDEENLMKSGIRNTNPGEGQVIWDTSYAKRLYHNPQYNFSKDRNPQAQGLWFEAAKSNHLKDWEKILSRTAKEFF